MKKALIIIGKIILGIIALILIAFIIISIRFNRISSKNMKLAGSEAPVLEENGFSFRDLNKNGELDIYEDSQRKINERIDDLVSQMTVEEKAGMLFHTSIVMNKDGTLLEKLNPGNIFSFISPSNSSLILKKLMNHFNVYLVADPGNMAAWYNRVQKLAERTRLGIPVTISSDPRHAFSSGAANFASDHFSKWCEPIGFGAIGDSAFVARFGDIARQEYLAVGIRTALHPMADLATEPRWARISGTFGSDALLSKKLIAAYIYGFQGDSIGPESVTCMTKHFPGGGPQKDGWDAHFPYGQDQVYPGNHFDYHQIPFEGAFAANTGQIMPYYGVPLGQTNEDVAFSYNKQVITGLLRNKYGFDGVVCTDWGIVTKQKLLGVFTMEPRSYGVFDLTEEERFIKAIDAGVDQFGGEAEPEMITKLVKEGKIKESRIDVSVKRLLRDKFRLGLFDNPYVNEEKAEQIVGKKEFKQLGELSQRKAIVLLKNGDHTAGKPLPLGNNIKIYVENIDIETAAGYGTVTDNPEEADFAILRLATPYTGGLGKGILERFFHQGDLDFKGEEKAHILEIAGKVPTIIDIYLERPAVIPEIAKHCKALIANFGASDKAVLDVIFGKFNPSGKLPFELPSSMEAVKNQNEDVSYDSKDPLFPFGFGLTFDDE
jgi:beta-glucosidase